MSETRIYVACLASYNAGTLHGEWVDVDKTSTVDEIDEQIQAMLKASPCPNVFYQDCSCNECKHTWRVQESGDGTQPSVCPECDSQSISYSMPYRSAEEWAIHDHEGFGDLLGEHSSLEDVVRHAAMLAEHGDAWLAYVNYLGANDATEDDFRDHYQGEYDSLEDWAEQWLDDTGTLNSIPETLRHYFDVDAWARDAELNGDIWSTGVNGKVYVFNN